MNPSQAEQEYIAAATQGMRDDNPRAYLAMDGLGSLLLAEFHQAIQERRDTEQRWLKDLRQYRGVYEPETESKIGPNRSKAFVRATRVKVKTADARVTDLLFPANSERNWTAEPTPVPTIDRTTRRQLVEALREQRQSAPTRPEIDAAIAKWAKDAAARMTRVIDDQLAEAGYKNIARKVLHSGHLYGTGILKAPLVERKTRTKYRLHQGAWRSRTESYVVPFVDYVPLWRFYPDMSATELAECRYVYERHLMTRAQLAKLANNPSFDAEKIRATILANPNGSQSPTEYDSQIRQIGERSSGKADGRYEVLERWGWLDGELLAASGVEVPAERLHETFFANCWLLPSGEVLKIVLQPIEGVTWPYHLYYADKDETNLFGDGFAAIMRDDQTMINAGTRMVLDNAALTAGPQIEVNLRLLSATEQADQMYPFKIWARNGEEPGTPAIRVLNLPNGLDTLMPLINMFKLNADDVTAIPRYMQGENATQGAAGTASGMSMLMTNASIVMKDLITNYDEGVTRTFIEALYRWNMQFNSDHRIKGDFDIKARGTASLMAKEVRAQQLDQFAATLGPADAPFIKREALLRQRAEAHDLASVIKTEQEVADEQNTGAAQQQAQMQQQAQQMQQQAQQLQMAQAQLNLAKMQGEVDKLHAEVERIRAVALKTKVEAAYAGMQAGGVATERPTIAPAGDAILQAAGWRTALPLPGVASTGAVASGMAVQGHAPVDNGLPTPPAMPNAGLPGIPRIEPGSGEAGANVGVRHGIGTTRIETAHPT